MGKKCIPGVICVENMTLFILFFILLLIVYMFYNFSKLSNQVVYVRSPAISVPAMPDYNNVPMIAGISTRNAVAESSSNSDPFNDPYAPPLKSNTAIFGGPVFSGDVRGTVPPVAPIVAPSVAPSVAPINVPSRGMRTGYGQIGILTRSNGRDDMILPLMGRPSLTGRNKMQYYTISNNGNINTKLPVSVNGRSCTSDNGCDEINNNDTVYVEGYKDTFVATIYESGTFSYLPYI
jgi:hypothetical protein